MDKVEICKLVIGDQYYRVNQACNEDVLLDEFRVMHNRHIAKGGAFFNDRRAAIMFMLRYAFNEVSQTNIVFDV